MALGTKTGELTKYVDRTFNNEMSAVALKEIEDLRRQQLVWVTKQPSGLNYEQYVTFSKKGYLFVDGMTDGKGIIGSGDIAYRSNDMSVGQGKVVLLSHFEGNNAQVTYTAETGQIATFYGTAQLKADQKRFGATSMWFDGNSDYITFPDSDDWWFDNQNFTIDFWVRFDSVSSIQCGFVDQYVDATHGWYICYDNFGYTPGLIFFRSYNTNAYDWFKYCAWTPLANTWYHLAFVRTGNDGYIFIDGKSQSVTYNDVGIIEWVNYAAAPLRVGRGNVYYMYGYIDELRITKGYARWTTDFIPSNSMYDMNSGAFESNVIRADQTKIDPSVLLMHFNTMQGTNEVIDEKGHKATLVGGAVIDYNVKRFGAASLRLDGSSGYVTMPDSDDWDFGAGDFTIELWVKFAAMGTQQYFVSQGDPNGGDFWNVRIGADGNVIMQFQSGGSGENKGYYWTGAGGWTIANQWVHFAFVRNGANGYIFINGLDYTGGYAVTFSTNDVGTRTALLSIGADNVNGNFYLNGWVDELRITKGIARYTSNFECPMAPFANDESVTVSPKKLGMVVKSEVVPQPVLLLHCNGMDTATAVRDEMGHTVTCVGTAQIKTNQYKFGWSSLWLDGNSDYLTVPDSNEWYFGTEDFTIDCWVRFNNLPIPAWVATFFAQHINPSNIIQFGLSGASGLGFYSAYTGGTTIYVTEGISPVGRWITGTWYHIALVRYRDTITIYKNGILLVSGSVAGLPVPNLGSTVRIGTTEMSEFFEGWIDEYRVTKGFALWTTDFTPPDREAPSDYHFVGSTEPQIDYNTKLLLHFDSYDTSTDIRDECKHLVTPVGTAQIDTAQSKFSGSSLLLDGNSDYLLLPDSDDWWFEDNDFTIDLWLRFNSVASQAWLCGQYDGSGGGSNNGFYFGWHQGSSTFYFVYTVDGLHANRKEFTASWSPSTNIWYHIAITRNGNNLRVFINGLQLGSTFNARTDSFYNSTRELSIGAIWDSGLGYYGWLNGWLDEFRITKGLARWTTDFIPPTSSYGLVDSTKTINTTIAPRTVDPYTKLLLHCNGYNGSTAFKDECSKIVTAVGTAQHSVAQNKFGNSSALFDGNSDYLSLADSDDWNLNLVAWTIDFWVRFNSVTDIDLCGQRVDVNTWWGIRFNGAGVLGFHYISGGAWVCYASSNACTMVANTWYHIAISRLSPVADVASWGIFVNGVRKPITSSFGLGASIGDLAVPFTVGWIGEHGYLDGYLDEFRFSKGIARWLGDFTPPTREYAITEATVVPSIQVARDADVYTKLLLHCNDYNDELGKVVTPVGGVSLDYYTKKFGDYAYKFDGSTGYVSIPDSDDWYFGTGDFTIECWVYVNTLPTDTNFGYIVGQYTAGNNNWRFALQNYVTTLGGTGWYLEFRTPTTDVYFVTGGGFVVTGRWYHIAAIRRGNSFMIFQDGVQLASYGPSWNVPPNGSLADYAAPLEIGRVASPAHYLNGWIDELRISKGIARYTSNFTPQATPFVLATYKEVSLLQDSIGNGYYRTQELVDLQDLPVGQNLKYKVDLANSNQRKIQGVGLYWR